MAGSVDTTCLCCGGIIYVGTYCRRCIDDMDADISLFGAVLSDGRYSIKDAPRDDRYDELNFNV